MKIHRRTERIIEGATRARDWYIFDSPVARLWELTVVRWRERHV